MDRRKLLNVSATGAWLVAAPAIGRADSARLSTPDAGVPSHRVSLRGSSFDGLHSIRDFGALGDGVADDTAALQRAISHVMNEGVKQSDTSHLPGVLLPAGHYKLSDTIATAPWIKLCSAGGVLLDFTSLALNKNGIVCRNEVMFGPGDLRYPGNRSPFLDGSRGTISVLGPGSQRSDGWGVVMGNTDSKFKGEVRDAGGRNIVITGWRGALRIDSINTYLIAWTSSRFEQNREAAIYVPALRGPSVNSGERMSFFDCTFASSTHALYVDTDSQDFVFDACSFDFNGDVISFGPRSGYGTVALSHCHAEGFDGMLVDAVKAGDRIRVTISHSTILPRRWLQGHLPNAPRQLIAGHCSFSSTAVEFRFERPQIDTHEVLIGDEVQVEALSGLSFQGYDLLPARVRCLNPDAEFRHDAAGTLVDRLEHWKAATGDQAVSGRVMTVADAGNGAVVPPRSNRALVLKAPVTGGAKLVLSARSAFMVTPGETVCAVCCVSGGGTLGNIVVSIDFLASDGSVFLNISTPSSRGPGIATLRAVAPAGATQGRLVAGFNNWLGDLSVTRLAAWRAA
ncbi:Pectate lyase superfamily protein [Paraburkholderia fungorum]|uniref:Pectate lyase superfamily protein n=1 Tax=Paraburkholderia fungorum TaxID=134537 RepID=A0A1H1HFP0_9BURK|nr:glycosyl hydrolase family 28-related protein [Paraburkholderia fungorum]SDR24189.1 Pectate lyase superfamily protein [Paraburkholderia fungorum]